MVHATLAATATADRTVSPNSNAVPDPGATITTVSPPETVPAETSKAAMADAAPINPPPPVPARSGASASPSSIIDCDSGSEEDSGELKRESSGANNGSRSSASKGRPGTAATTTTSSVSSKSSKGSKGSCSSHTLAERAEKLKEVNKERLGVDEAYYGRGKRAIKPLTIKVGHDYIKLSNAYEVRCVGDARARCCCRPN